LELPPASDFCCTNSRLLYI